MTCLCCAVCPCGPIVPPCCVQVPVAALFQCVYSYRVGLAGAMDGGCMFFQHGALGAMDVTCCGQSWLCFTAGSLAAAACRAQMAGTVFGQRLMTDQKLAGLLCLLCMQCPRLMVSQTVYVLAVD